MGDAHGIDCDPGYDNSGLCAQKQWRSEEACIRIVVTYGASLLAALPGVIGTDSVLVSRAPRIGT